jgi:hypothetical protein
MQFVSYANNGISLIYQKKSKSASSLINYWAFNGNVDDSIGNAHLYGGVNAALTFDRFGRPNSALSLTSGYYKIPPGVFFSGTQFTIMAWVKVGTFISNSRLIDFGNGPNQDNIVSILNHFTTSKPTLFLQSGNNYFFDSSTITLNLNQWQHLACVYSFPYYSFYIDGIDTTLPGSKMSFESYSLYSVQRSSNFIGRSNWQAYGFDNDADADFDDLKIFNRALSKNEITFEMNNNL